MLSRIRNRKQQGFTLIELLIVVAIIGIIAALLIPNFLDALQKSKQKRTEADMRNLGTSMFSWLTDQAGAAAAGQASTTVNVSDYADATITHDALAGVLVSQYIQSVPVNDGWKDPFSFYLRTTGTLTNPHVMMIISYGRDGKTDGGAYTVTGFDPTDYDRDLVWADGFFVRWPQKQ
jgi:prepilin-type N-terminal cleavage/methylation domain-containing protein